MQFLEKIKSNPTILFKALLFLLLLVYLAFIYYRFPARDETYYLRETLIMSDVIKNGQWFGDYAVGLHGFLFKLPLALVFMFTGPSVLAATLYNYLLAILTLWFTYRTSKYFFKEEFWQWGLVVLLACSFEFVRSTPTYLREIPSLLSVIFFTYLYLKNGSKWLLGLGLLLVLDAKEYMFFIVGLGYVLSEGVLFWRRGLSVQNFKTLAWDFARVFSFSFAYIALMFTTSLVPLNTFLASILGLIDRGFAWNAQQLSTGMVNVAITGDYKEIFQIGVQTDYPIINSLISLVNQVIGYLGKFLYPRSFSYISIPRILIVPALIVGFIKTKEWIQKSDKRVLILSILIVFLAVFLLRSSHGRYLFPMSPFIFIFLLYFFKDYTNNVKLSLWILFAAWLVESLGLYFETSMEEVKMLISLCLLGLFVTVVYVRKKQPEWNLLASGVVVTSIAGISLFSALLFSYTQGQIAQMLEYGRHFEIRSITKELSGYDKIYINDTDTDHLINFYMSDLSLNPQWKWNIKSDLPKSQLVKIYEEPEIINIVPGSSLEMSPDRSALVIIESMIGHDPFGSQELLPNLLSSSQLNLVKKVELKNKIMYIFENAGSN